MITEPFSSSVKSTCPYCGVGCGVIATPKSDGTVAIEGDATHPANYGRLCSKGSALGETLSLDGRLLHPSIAGRRVSWDEALDRIARRFAEAIAEHGPDSVGFYVSGQLLTEDYYVANKLMKGFIGSANIDTNSRLCMASAVAGYKRAFGTDTVPGTYRDLEEADLVVLVGSNLAWCHPVLYQRLATARAERGIKVVVIDPRETATCEIADLHLSLKPGSDVALFNGLLAYLADAGVLDAAFTAKHTNGFDAAVAAARAQTLASVATATGLAIEALRDFYELFARTGKVVTAYSQGVNQSTSGTDKANAIINCHLATGRIGRPGMGPFSITGQPNAMGGREAGGLANTLAAHMEFGNREHARIVGSFWGTDRLAQRPGLKAVDMFRAADEGRLKAIWVMATNPVVSMPEADLVARALKRCPFVVVSDVEAKTDTMAYAHVALPSLAWGEKDGTVTNSERRISRQRAFLPAPGEARADWWQMAEVGKRMGFQSEFDYGGAWEVFTEYARLTGAENHGSRDLDISAYGSNTRAEYDCLEPFQWPQTAGTVASDKRFFGEGGFYTPDRRANFIAVTPRSLAAEPDRQYPLILNTGRVRDHWHTMTRTGKTPRLMRHVGEPQCEINPADAARCGLIEGGLAIVYSPHGAVILRVSTTAAQPKGRIFAPMHWNDQFAANARINALVPGNVDPISGQPELKGAPVAVRPYACGWYGLAVVREREVPAGATYWAAARTRGGWLVELAGPASDDDWTPRAAAYLGASETRTLVAYHDRAAGEHRFALFDGDMLSGLLFVSKRPLQVSRTWAGEQIGLTFAKASDRLRVLAGRPGGDAKDRGAIVCACFDVGLNQIAEAVVSGGCRSVDSIGAALKAGTNCGSCRSQIAHIVRETVVSRPMMDETA